MTLDRKRAVAGCAVAALFVLSACGSSDSQSSSGSAAASENSSSTMPDIERKLENVPSRTSLAVATSEGIMATDNAKEQRPGLSVSKLYIADYALRHGEISDEDFELAERMIKTSDDFAADVLFNKYPESIDKVAEEYGLKDTASGATWGGSLTTANDVAKYLDEVKKTRPHSYIQRWMRSSGDIATDGTYQRWGTATLPGVEGTKWGWSDFGKKSVASASVGSDFSAVAFTWGTADSQTEDVENIAAMLD